MSSSFADTEADAAAAWNALSAAMAPERTALWDALSGIGTALQRETVVHVTLNYIDGAFQAAVIGLQHRHMVQTHRGRGDTPADAMIALAAAIKETTS